MQRGTPVTGFPYLDAVVDQPGAVLAMAHRGGAEHPELDGLENTWAAFRHAAELGYTYLETDVHVTRDGVLVAFHDDVLDRVTDETGAIADRTAATVARALIGGREPIPLMADLLEELPDARFNIDIKAGAAVRPLVDLIDRTGAHERVCVGSFGHARLVEFRRLSRGRVATSASPIEVAAALVVPSAGLRRALSGVQALQVPAGRGPLPIVTKRFVRRAHAAGLHVHVWTVDDPDEMVDLLDLGVDGLITDRTDLLHDLLVERAQWLDRSTDTGQHSPGD